MLHYFRGTCEAIRAMHTFRAPLGSASEAAKSKHPQPSSKAPPERNRRRSGSDDEDEDALLPHPEGDADGGYSYGGSDASASVPLVSRHAALDEGEVVFDGDEELAGHGLSNGNADTSQTEVVPYAHRDMKPGFVPDASFVDYFARANFSILET